jgi:uncharacterized protein
MMMTRRVESVKRLVGKLSFGADLLEELGEMCLREEIRFAWFAGLGAVSKACVAYYDQEKREYLSRIIDRRLEITHLVGNVSLRDDSPFVHAHVTLADGEGHAYGGHLASGTVIFACEIVLEAFSGPAPERVYDQTTGLYLWKGSDR